ncbi:MAG: thymidine phosphorylase, partial [Clostridia bacterium]
LERGPLELAPVTRVVCATASGVVVTVDPRAVGRSALQLGAGRMQKGAPVDPGVGVRILVKVGQPVLVGEPLAEVYARSDDAAGTAASALQNAIQIGARATPRPVVLGHLVA